MLDEILALLPKVGSVVAALPEFARVIDRVKDTLTEDDQAVLKSAYALALQDAAEANAELEALIAARSA